MYSQLEINGSTYVNNVSRSYNTETQKNEKLAKTCKDFESVFLTILWRDMTKSSGLNAGEWDVVLSQIMGKAWAEAGGIGLAKVLYKQLSKSSSENDLGDDNGGEFLPAEESQ